MAELVQADPGGKEAIVRTPRPTIALLKSLPIESFPDAVQRKQIAEGDWLNLEFYEIQHPLIEDGKRRFLGGNLPDQHRSASQAADRPVYELRDPDGAGWRGAALLDDNGDPWIVYAEKHNRFHRRAAEALDSAKQAGYWPTGAEYKLRAREEAAQADRHWRRQLLQSFVEALDCALRSGGSAVARLPERPGSDVVCDVLVELDHDVPPSYDSEDLAQTSTLVTVGLSFPSKPDRPLRDAAIQEIVPFLQPALDSIDSVYGKNGEMHTFLAISQAKLTQLIAAATTNAGELGTSAQLVSPTRLHYVGSRYLVEAFVYGKSVRAVCGTWFVPTRDDSASLPICKECDEERPIAQAVVDLIRSQLSEG